MTDSRELQRHPFPPLYDSRSRVLILGSFPSVKSREQRFFYGHPQNRFWKVIAYVTQQDVPTSIEEKRRLLLSQGIALWDVIASCEITGSSDSSIRNAVPTDLTPIFAGSSIRKIYSNGGLSGRLFCRYQMKEWNGPFQVLPSTSPANAAWSLERLCEAWSVIRDELSCS